MCCSLLFNVVKCLNGCNYWVQRRPAGVGRETENSRVPVSKVPMFCRVFYDCFCLWLQCVCTFLALRTEDEGLNLDPASCAKIADNDPEFLKWFLGSWKSSYSGLIVLFW